MGKIQPVKFFVKEDRRLGRKMPYLGMGMRGYKGNVICLSYLVLSECYDSLI